ncbi:MAG: tyrosine-type recombinase/integrase [Acidobacteriia bacterium]|nr:tyrosine-type recombinase/integrase [Terriglobia bacterium]
MSPRHSPERFQVCSLDQAEADRARFKNADLAPLTLASYGRDFRVFRAWCEAAGRSALPASEETVELYVVSLLRHGRRITTLRRHAIGIQHFHRGAGHESPCGASLRALLAGAQRVLHQRPIQKAALCGADLKRVVGAFLRRGSVIAARDLAIVLFGLGSALRRSNLAALRLEDLTFTSEGVLVWVASEKQERTGAGRILAVCAGKHARTCPVRALHRWIQHRGYAPGPLFCHVMRGRPMLKPLLGNRITQIVQQAVAAVGLDPRHYGAHSLRASFVTEALSHGANEIAVARQTGHRSLDTLRLYERSRNPWQGHAGAALGL